MASTGRISEDGAAEYRQQNLEDLEGREPPMDCGSCGERTWRFRGVSVYGDDADGNRGVPMEAWECACGNEIEVTG